MKTDTNNSRIF